MPVIGRAGGFLMTSNGMASVTLKNFIGQSSAVFLSAMNLSRHSSLQKRISLLGRNDPHTTTFRVCHLRHLQLLPDMVGDSIQVMGQ